jgi:hypothetical protein
VSGRASNRAYLSGGVSRAWRPADSAGVPAGDRKELSIGAAYVLTPRITTYGSVGRTFATLPENGAGTSISAGISLATTIRGT